MSESAFHTDDFQEVVEYQQLSGLAIASLLLGLASPLCLVSRFFLLIPLFGVVLSIVALRRIAASEGGLAGRGLAIVGLALCVAFGVAELSRGLVTRYARSSQARAVGEDWLRTLAAGKLEAAFRATAKGSRPPFPQEPGMPPPERTPYEEFTANDVVRKIAAAGEEAKINFQGTEEFEPESRRHFVVKQRFRIQPAIAEDGVHAQPLDISLTVHRSRFPGDNRSRWLVTGYELAQDGAK